MKSFRIFLAISILCLFSPVFSRANDSLFKPEDARKLDTSEVRAFGPKAGKFRYDTTMLNAARIAADRAHAHSQSTCWRYVKQALLAAKTIDSYPKTTYAKQAGGELTKSYGFTKLRVRIPLKLRSARCWFTADAGPDMSRFGLKRVCERFRHAAAVAKTAHRRLREAAGLIRADF